MLGRVRTSATSKTGSMCLYPSLSFLSKNLLAKEDPDVIPALSPTLDKSLKVTGPYVRVRTSATIKTGPKCLYPSLSFLSKNQLAKEDPDVTPALAPTLGKSLKVTGPYVQSEPCATIWVGCSGRPRSWSRLVQERFQQDISPATISSWIKQD